MLQTRSSHIMPTLKHLSIGAARKNIEPFPLTSGGVREYIEDDDQKLQLRLHQKAIVMSEAHQ